MKGPINLLRHKVFRSLTFGVPPSPVCLSLRALEQTDDSRIVAMFIFIVIFRELLWDVTFNWTQLEGTNKRENEVNLIILWSKQNDDDKLKSRSVGLLFAVAVFRREVDSVTEHTKVERIRAEG